MTDKFTWNRCIEFAQVAELYLNNHRNAETKLTYAIKRVAGQIAKHQPVINERMADIEIDYAYTEKKGDEDVIVYDAAGKLQYTKEGQKQRNAAKMKYVSEANVSIDPHFATQLPSGLSVFEIEAFAGFVIKQEDADRLLAELEEKAGTDVQTVDPSQNGHAAAVAVPV